MNLDANAEERRNIRIMLRWISGFVAWPSLTIAFAFLLVDPGEHVLHIAGLLPLGLAAVALFFLSPRVALRYYPPDMVEST